MEMIKPSMSPVIAALNWGYFKEKTRKSQLLKCLKKELASYIETGVEWILISGNLGVELWTAEVVGELKRNIQKFS